LEGGYLIILGIDPGMATMGYGVIRSEKSRIEMIDFGAITTPSSQPIPMRLASIFESVGKLITHYKPDAVAFEELFFNKNVKTALIVGHARGAAMVAAAKEKKDLFEYTPLQVKQAVVGYGRADKQQVQNMVRILLNLKEIPKPDDAADALAVAICHAHSSKMGEMFKIR
jgi:crossover junction endodeoxyribonuclease RuvC